MSKNSITQIALIGATGNLGPAILQALLAHDFEVTILTREGSTSSDTIAPHPRQKIAKVNFADHDSLTAALTGIEGVVSNIASNALLTQTSIIDAAIAAGVTRFIPSAFGADLTNPANQVVPFNGPKCEVQKYLVNKTQSSSSSSFSYTSITNGPFLDWCLHAGILIGDLHHHDTTLWDGGDTPFSTTTLASVGAAVAGVFHNLAATQNREIRVADTTVTQLQLIDMVKSIDGKQWTTRPGSTDEAYGLALEEMKKPDGGDFRVVVLNQLVKFQFCKANGPGYAAEGLDNELVGLKGMSEEEVREVVRRCMA